MSIDWDDYEVYQPGRDRPPWERSRSEARSEFERLMAAKGERIEMLRRLLAANGVELDGSDRGVQALNDWLCRELEPDPNDPGAPRKLWFSVLNDIALFLGDVMIERVPGLKWRLFEHGRTNVAYHQPVIMGFDTLEPNYNVDLRGVLGTYAHRIVGGEAEGEDDLFVRILEASEQHGAKSPPDG